MYSAVKIFAFLDLAKSFLFLDSLLGMKPTLNPSGDLSIEL